MTLEALDGLVDEIEGMTHPDGGVVADPAQQPAQQQQQQQQPPDDPGSQEPTELEPPAHWPDQDKEMFQTLTPEAKTFMLRRHREMEGDYTRKTQYVSEQMKAVAGLQGLAVHLQRDPSFRQHLQSYFTMQAQQQPAPGSGKDGVDSSDPEITPVEQLKMEAADMAYERIRREQAAQSAQMSQLDRDRKMQSIINMKQNDPLAVEVQKRLDEYVDSQPLDWQKKSVYDTLASNPDIYYQMYAHYRRQVENEGGQQGGQQGDHQPGQRTNIVQLERGGGDRRPTTNEAKRKRINTLKHQALASGETEALANFLDEAGVIDSLL